jgi:hypothetical protein
MSSHERRHIKQLDKLHGKLEEALKSHQRLKVIKYMSLLARAKAVSHPKAKMVVKVMIHLINGIYDCSTSIDLAAVFRGDYDEAIIHASCSKASSGDNLMLLVYTYLFEYTKPDDAAAVQKSSYDEEVDDLMLYSLFDQFCVLKSDKHTDSSKQKLQLRLKLQLLSCLDNLAYRACDSEDSRMRSDAALIMIPMLMSMLSGDPSDLGDAQSYAIDIADSLLMTDEGAAELFIQAQFANERGETDMPSEIGGCLYYKPTSFINKVYELLLKADHKCNRQSEVICSSLGIIGRIATMDPYYQDVIGLPGLAKRLHTLLDGAVGTGEIEDAVYSFLDDLMIGDSCSIGWLIEHGFISDTVSAIRSFIDSKDGHEANLFKYRVTFLDRCCYNLSASIDSDVKDVKGGDYRLEDSLKFLLSDKIKIDWLLSKEVAPYRKMMSELEECIIQDTSCDELDSSLDTLIYRAGPLIDRHD